jgi:hypothetical protein
MRVRVLLNTDGSIKSILTGAPLLVDLNTPDQAYFVDDPDHTVDRTDYFDSDTHDFVSVGEAPSNYHEFDYSFKQWIDPRSPDEIKAQKWTKIKSERDSLEFGGFEFDGNIYDSNQVSQGRIMGAASAGINQTWTLADNTTVELSAMQLQQLYAALQAHIASVHERGRIARQLIFDAETKEQVEAVQL